MPEDQCFLPIHVQAFLKTIDIANEVETIWVWEIQNDEFIWTPAIQSPNEGINYFEVITNDDYSNKRLRNGSPYYFAVTTYGYSKFSIPQYLESTPQILEIFPGTQKIDVTYPYDSGEDIEGEQIVGGGDGWIGLRVVDPNALTGDEYRVNFEGPDDSVTYTFINHTTNDTLATDCTSFIIDTLTAPVYDGFMLLVQDLYQLALQPGQNFVIKNIIETEGPGGVDLDPPVEVIASRYAR